MAKAHKKYAPWTEERRKKYISTMQARRELGFMPMPKGLGEPQPPDRDYGFSVGVLAMAKKVKHDVEERVRSGAPIDKLMANTVVLCQMILERVDI